MAASTSVTDSLDSLDVEQESIPVLIKYSIILLGDLGVGKSSLFRRLNVNGFVEFDAATIGKAFCTVKTKTLENVVVSRCWRPVSTSYYVYACCIFADGGS